MFVEVNLNPYKKSVGDCVIRAISTAEDMDWDDISDDAKKHGMKDDFGKAILKNGTRVTVKNIKEDKGCVWLLIPSGYICGKNSKLTYVY